MRTPGASALRGSLSGTRGEGVMGNSLLIEKQPLWLKPRGVAAPADGGGWGAGSDGVTARARSLEREVVGRTGRCDRFDSKAHTNRRSLAPGESVRLMNGSAVQRGEQLESLH